MKKEITIRNCIFAFKCKAEWDELDNTEDDRIKFCNDCQKEVYLCSDDDQLVKAIKLNRCVALVRYKSAMELGLIMDIGINEIT